MKKTVTIFLLLLLAGCEKPITSGRITEIRMRPVHSETYYVTSIDCGKYCSIPIYNERIVPARYEFHLDNGTRDDWNDVNQETYGRYRVGQMYP